jgi:predicted TIM-barrel fold metal-dependent hydrolase
MDMVRRRTRVHVPDVPLDRRSFLRESATALLGSSLAVSASDVLANDERGMQPQAERLPVIDTHLHCFAGPNDTRFPYHDQAPYRPAEPATPEHLLACMDGAGVDHAIVVHPEPYQDDHRYLEHCLEIGGDRLKGTCLFFADRPGSIGRLAALVKALPGRIVAARIHAYAPERLPPFGRPELRALWKASTDLGLAVQLHFEPRYAPGFEPLIREFRETTVVIDHLGRPFQGTPEEHAVVVGWSRLPNTVMKIAAVPPPTSYPHRDIRPVIRQLTDAWGADRMIYGGGFSAAATPQSYRRHREELSEYLTHLSERERQMIFGGTANRLFGFTQDQRLRAA